MTAETRSDATGTGTAGADAARSGGASQAGERAEVLLDVRPLIDRGEEPFGKIMATVAGLDGRSLVLVAPFEPTPLFGVLSAQGFTYESRQLGDAEWRVRFSTSDMEGPAEAEPSETAEPERSDTTVTEPADITEGKPERAEAEAEAGASGGVSPFTIRRPVSAGEPMPAGMPPSLMTLNPTLNVPPAWLPLGFLAAAGAGLVGFGVAVMATAPTAVDLPRSSDVIAAVHLGVLAFLSTAVLGALHQFGPVVGGQPLRSIRAGVATGVLFVAGAWIIPLGFVSGHNGIVQLGGVLATTGVCIAAWNISRPLSSSGKGAPIVGLRLAVSFLVLTAAFGVTYAFDRENFWFALLSHRVLAHAHLGLLGWLGLAYVAVAEKLWPMFLLSHRPQAREGERAVWLVGAGAPVVTVGLLFGWSAVAMVGGLLVLAGLGFHLASLTSVIRHRRRNLELLHGFVLASAAFLVAAIAIAVVAGLAPLDTEIRSRLVAAEVFSLILWLALAVLGHSHKIVPFIAWNRLRSRGITRGRDGRPLLFAHLVESSAATATFVMAAAGATVGLAGLLLAVPTMLRLGGSALALSGLLTAANLASGPLRMIEWQNRQDRATTPVAARGD